MAAPRGRRQLTRSLQESVTVAMRRTAEHLDARFTEEISAPKWDFPTPPQVRDIVDTGRLRASQTRTVNEDGSVTFTWPVAYAAQVHDGGVGLNGQRFPGRPWTREPLKELPEVFARQLAQAIQEGQP